jgi:hypothetical protein
MGLLDNFKKLNPMQGLDAAQAAAKKAEDEAKKKVVVQTQTSSTNKPAFHPTNKFGQSDAKAWNKTEYDAWKKAQEGKK